MGAADQGNRAATDQHRTDGRQHRHRAAVQGGDDVLLRGHRHHHRNVHRAPEADAHLAILGHAAAFLHPQPRADQQDHGDADPADVGFDAQQHAEHVAHDHPCQRTDRQQRHTVNNHCCSPQSASSNVVFVVRSLSRGGLWSAATLLSQQRLQGVQTRTVEGSDRARFEHPARQPGQHRTGRQFDL